MTSCTLIDVWREGLHVERNMIILFSFLEGTLEILFVKDLFDILMLVLFFLNGFPKALVLIRALLLF